MDFITGLPPSKGKSVLMVVVDRLSKYGHFVALPANFSSSTVASAFVQEVVRLHGIPTEIISDRDPRFLSDFWQEMHRLQGTTLAMSSAYHPQTDGQTEALNKCVEMYLRCFVADRPSSWMLYLPWAEFWYNTAYQTSARMTPFEILYGRKPPTVARYVKDSSGNTLVDSQLLERDKLLSLLKGNLHKAQSKMKFLADRKRQEVEFSVGDWVYVKLQPFRQNSIRLQRHCKLGRRFFGPYEVIQQVGSVAYKLALPDAAQIHPVFHVSLLKRCVGKPDQQVTPLHMVDSTSSMVLHPSAILDTRMTHRGNFLVEQLLVQWEGLTTAEATWEDKEKLRRSFPHLNLEDKVEINGGSTVVGTNNIARSNNAGIDNNALGRGLRHRMPSKRMRDYVLDATWIDDG